MELLDAVNTVMPYLGEHVVTDTDTTTHPTVDLIVKGLERNTRAILAEGWWFNDVTLRIGLTTDKRIPKPSNALNVYGICTDVVIDGDFLFNLTGDSMYFTEPVEVRVIKDIPFEDLPIYAAQTVLYKTAMEIYVADLGVDNTVQMLQGLYEQSRQQLVQDNLRNRKYNTSRNYRGFHSGLRRPRCSYYSRFR